MDLDFNLKFLSFNRKITLSKQAVQYGIGSLTIVLATIASYWGSMPIFLVLLALFVGLGGLFVLVRQPALGYFLLLLGGIFLPFSGPGGINASMLTILLMVFLWVMDMLVVKRQFDFVRSSLTRATFYFMVVCVVALLMGQVFWYVTAAQAPLDTQLGGFAIYFFSLVTLVMTGSLIKDLRWLKAFVWMFVGLGAVYVLARALNFFTIDQYYANGYTANSMLWTWLLAIPLAQLLFNQDLSKRQRFALLCMVLVTMYVAMIQARDWKSGWVPPLVSALALLALRYRKLILIGIPLAMIYGGIVVQDLIATDTYSWGTRVDAWLVVLEISKVSPLIGLGFANYYWYAPLFNLRGYYIQFNSHSQYVDLIAQTGIIGLFCFLWILFEVTRLAWSLKDKVTEGFSRAYAYGIIGGMAGVILAAFLVDWVLPFAYNIGLDGFRASILPWVFFGGLVSIQQIYLREKSS
ncbi:MAG: hypothetical protein IT313_05930 [Anaerolineales bacterium]|nr:hypothetical protein [Anaerolineales bacterium]